MPGSGSHPHVQSDAEPRAHGAQDIQIGDTSLDLPQALHRTRTLGPIISTQG